MVGPRLVIELHAGDGFAGRDAFALGDESDVTALLLALLLGEVRISDLPVDWPLEGVGFALPSLPELGLVLYLFESALRVGATPKVVDPALLDAPAADKLVGDRLLVEIVDQGRDFLGASPKRLPLGFPPRGFC